ncbi:hypothetical protein LZG72_18245 [Dyadobacter sp. CY323]|nr:hypothetical protein [Dyadobacter sp. CY323]
MPQITNKFKLSGLFATALIASCMFISCGKEKTSDEADTTAPADTTQVAPMEGDSVPIIVDSTASKRPEPRTT